MRLYHVRDHDRGGTLDSRDEEECFSADGRAIGVWLTTEASDGPRTYSADVDDEAVAAFEINGSEHEHRTFVVPGTVVATLGFACP